MKLQVEIGIKKLVRVGNRDGYVEFEAESDALGGKSFSTGVIHAPFSNVRREWDLGRLGQHIWFWWDTMCGTASLKLTLLRDEPPANEVIFDADSAGTYIGQLLAIEP